MHTHVKQSSAFETPRSTLEDICTTCEEGRPELIVAAIAQLSSSVRRLEKLNAGAAAFVVAQAQPSPEAGQQLLPQKPQPPQHSGSTPKLHASAWQRWPPLAQQPSQQALDAELPLRKPRPSQQVAAGKQAHLAAAPPPSSAHLSEAAAAVAAAALAVNGLSRPIDLPCSGGGGGSSSTTARSSSSSSTTSSVLRCNRGRSGSGRKSDSGSGRKSDSGAAGAAGCTGLPAAGGSATTSASASAASSQRESPTSVAAAASGVQGFGSSASLQADAASEALGSSEEPLVFGSLVSVTGEESEEGCADATPTGCAGGGRAAAVANNGGSNAPADGSSSCDARATGQTTGAASEGPMAAAPASDGARTGAAWQQHRNWGRVFHGSAAPAVQTGHQGASGGLHHKLLSPERCELALHTTRGDGRATVSSSRHCTQPQVSRSTLWRLFWPGCAPTAASVSKPPLSPLLPATAAQGTQEVAPGGTRRCRGTPGTR
jgi:hypothetical protein